MKIEQVLCCERERSGPRLNSGKIQESEVVKIGQMSIWGLPPVEISGLPIIICMTH